MDEKRNISRHWNLKPCGSRTSRHPIGSRDYFQEMDRYRYGEYAWWLPRMMGFKDAKDKQVLEIGTGQGADLAMFARNGAHCSGVDITREHLELTRTRFQQEKLDVNLMYGDAESLPIRSRSIDIVYSYGVLHHTPETETASSAGSTASLSRAVKPGLCCMPCTRSSIYIS